MLDIEVSLKGTAIDHALERYSEKIRGEVLVSGAAAMAKVIYDEVLLNTSGARASGAPDSPPQMRSGRLHSAVYRVFSPERSDEDTKSYLVSVNKRKAPQWHWIEYGNSRHPAHPYLRPAFSRVQDAIDAGKQRIAQKLAGQ